MKIVKTFKGVTGSGLLSLITDDGSPVEIGGESTLLMPCTLPFANRCEIASKGEADYVAVQTRLMDRGLLVRI